MSTSIVDWDTLLDRATTGVGLRPVFQPIVDLQRFCVVGFEALSRFDVPDAPPAGPDQWFEEAARRGRGPELDAAALSAILPHRTTLPPNCFLTVNVDPNHLLDPAVRSVFADQPTLEGLVVEFTEHHSWDWSELEATVGMLRSAGALIAIDDAGSGHSGLQQILELRPSIVKLDRSIVCDIHRDEAKAALVEMMGVFADRVDAWILAEGVETFAEARRLCDLGVPLVQGYFFGRPADPWVGIDAVATANFETPRARVRDVTLESLMDRVGAIHGDAVRTHDWLANDESWMPVIDDRSRPVGVVDAGAAFDGEMLLPVVANLESSPQAVAQRVVTSTDEPRIPIVVIDDLGKYQGLVTMRRLLQHLASAV